MSEVHPRGLKAFRLALWAVVAIIVIALGGYLYFDRDGSTASQLSLGGPFTLTDQSGKTVTEAALQGHPSALFFGYTSCPDVCPTTLNDATIWLGQLGADGNKIKFYFVTVDPERDTQKQMADYLSAFDPRIEGLTGTRPQIDQMLKDYKVYSKKVGTGDDYSMDHSAAVYLLNDKAQFVGTVDFQEKSEDALAKLKRLVAG